MIDFNWTPRNVYRAFIFRQDRTERTEQQFQVTFALFSIIWQLVHPLFKLVYAPVFIIACVKCYWCLGAADCPEAGRGPGAKSLTNCNREGGGQRWRVERRRGDLIPILCLHHGKCEITGRQLMDEHLASAQQTGLMCVTETQLQGNKPDTTVALEFFQKSCYFLPVTTWEEMHGWNTECVTGRKCQLPMTEAGYRT